MRLDVYLTFDGQCEEAMTFYQSVLGGKIETMMKVAGSPAESQYPPEAKDYVLHAHLQLQNLNIMASDAPPALYSKPAGMQIVIEPDETGEAERIYAALSEGGAIEHEMTATFFAKRYAMFADRLGVRWMIVCGAPEQN